jgi:hypothetical protein
VLLLDRVDVEVVRARVLPDDHALVDLLARPDEQRAALLQREQGEGRRRALAVGDQRAGRPRAQLAEPRLPAVEDVVQQAGAARLGEELVRKPIRPAGRDEVVHPDPARAVVDHLLHAALAQRDHLGDDADVVVGTSIVMRSTGSWSLAVDLAGDDLRLADRQLVALAAHELDEDRQLQLAAALDLPDLGALRVDDADRDVADELLVEPVADLRAVSLEPLLPARGEVLMPERHRQGRLVDRDDGQRDRVLGVGERLADGDVGQAGDAMISPGPASAASTRSSDSVM